MQHDPLPTEDQRRRLCEMIAYAFIELRLLGHGGRANRAAELADLFHNLPREIYGWGNWDQRLFRLGLEEYQRKYAGEGGCKPYDYVKMFDDAVGKGGSSPGNL